MVIRPKTIIHTVFTGDTSKDNHSYCVYWDTSKDNPSYSVYRGYVQRQSFIQCLLVIRQKTIIHTVFTWDIRPKTILHTVFTGDTSNDSHSYSVYFVIRPKTIIHIVFTLRYVQRQSFIQCSLMICPKTILHTVFTGDTSKDNHSYSVH